MYYSHFIIEYDTTINNDIVTLLSTPSHHRGN